ncbi:hypothetical protein [Sphingomonas hylomeconis]|uniref:XRE family transcriptional regulator n=1 Tax=Sphingomonas hylomeconis TaxID=1395958 RepID=A0ABV7SW44_9SPHN|nr:hypothetical protein [Sphingomonas hylomeconis]
MLQFALPVDRRQAAPPALPPVTPAAYLRLRRKAAGLSVAAAARRIVGERGFDAASRLIRLLETEGVTARHRDMISGLADAFPLDADIYMQLCGAPAHQQPRICRGCGCSEWDPCVSADGAHRCGWAGPPACTRCAEAPGAQVRQ